MEGREVSTVLTLISAVGKQVQSCLLPSNFTVNSCRQYYLQSGRYFLLITLPLVIKAFHHGHTDVNCDVENEIYIPITSKFMFTAVDSTVSPKQYHKLPKSL